MITFTEAASIVPTLRLQQPQFMSCMISCLVSFCGITFSVFLFMCYITLHLSHTCPQPPLTPLADMAPISAWGPKSDSCLFQLGAQASRIGSLAHCTRSAHPSRIWEPCHLRGCINSTNITFSPCLVQTVVSCMDPEENAICNSKFQILLE